MGRAFRLLLISPSWSMHACVVDGWKRGGFGEMDRGDGWKRGGFGEMDGNAVGSGRW